MSDWYLWGISLWQIRPALSLSICVHVILKDKNYFLGFISLQMKLQHVIFSPSSCLPVACTAELRMAADERGLVGLLVINFYQNQVDHQNTAEGSSDAGCWLKPRTSSETPATTLTHSPHSIAPTQRSPAEKRALPVYIHYYTRPTYPGTCYCIVVHTCRTQHI